MRRHDFAESASAPTRRFEFDNINVGGPGMPQESSEEGFTQEQTSVTYASDMQHLYFAADPASRRRRRRSLDGERQIIPDNTTRDVSVDVTANIVRLAPLYLVRDISLGPTANIVRIPVICKNDHLCGLVARIPGYRSRGPGFDCQHYQIV
jgi:hypothetical protein